MSFECLGKLKGMYASAKVLTIADIKDESVEAMFKILEQLGEEPLQPMGNPQLTMAIQTMNNTIKQTTDDTFLSIEETEERNVLTLIRVYGFLMHLLHYRKQHFMASASLRLLELTLKHGLTPKSPIAFAYYGEVVSSMNEISLAMRLGEYHQPVCQ